MSNRKFRGIDSEAMVERALETLKKRKDPAIPPIRKIVHAGQNSNLDRQGIDFLVELEGGVKIPLQVKSSTRGRRKFESRCRRIGISIPVVVASLSDALGIIINRVVASIRLVLNSLQRRAQQDAHEIHARALRKIKKKAWCYRIHAASMSH